MGEPTPEQVETVARAIWMSAWEQAQSRLPAVARVVKKLHGDHWEDATDYTQEAHRRHARAAIAAWEQVAAAGGNDHFVTWRGDRA